MGMNLFVLIIWLAGPVANVYNPVVLGRYTTLQQCNAAAKRIPIEVPTICFPYYPDGTLPK